MVKIGLKVLLAYLKFLHKMLNILTTFEEGSIDIHKHMTRDEKLSLFQIKNKVIKLS